MRQHFVEAKKNEDEPGHYFRRPWFICMHPLGQLMPRTISHAEAEIKVRKRVQSCAWVQCTHKNVFKTWSNCVVHSAQAMTANRWGQKTPKKRRKVAMGYGLPRPTNSTELMNSQFDAEFSQASQKKRNEWQEFSPECFLLASVAFAAKGTQILKMSLCVVVVGRARKPIWNSLSGSLGCPEALCKDHWADLNPPKYHAYG